MIAGGLLVALAVLHAHWAIGGTWGTNVAATVADRNAGPPLPMDSRLVTWVLVAFLLGAGALMPVRIGWVRAPVPRWTTTASCAFVLFFGVVMLWASIASFGDPGSWSRFVYFPAALVLLAATCVVTFSSRALP